MAPKLSSQWHWDEMRAQLAEASEGRTQRPQAQRSATTPNPGTPRALYGYSTSAPTRTPYMRGTNHPASRSVQGPQPNTGFELVLTRDFQPDPEGYRASNYYVFAAKDAHEVKAELVRCMGKIAGYEAFFKMIRLLEWDVEDASSDHGNEMKMTKETRNLRNKAIARLKKDSKMQLNPLMTKSVEDFFNDAPKAPRPRPQGRMIRLPKPQDLDKHAEMIKAIQTTPFKSSSPLWKPEPNEFQDPHVLYHLPKGRSYLLLHKTTQRAYVRREDLVLFLVRRVRGSKRETRMVESDLDEEGWMLV